MAAPRRELLRLLPRVLRARDFHLYLEGGKRLTDLWLQGGRAILGHKPPKVLGELKNAAERGLFCSLPHPMERRFLKALGELFPERVFRLYMDEASLYRALEEAGFSGPFFDPAFPPQYGKNRKISLWRPFLEKITLGAILLPVLPWPLGPVVLVLEKTMDGAFPPGELIPPVLLAPATRALYDLAAVMKAKVPNQRSVRYPKIEKVFDESKSNGQKQQNGQCQWQRQGIYFTVDADMNNEKYETIFRYFLDGGFLIPPSPEEPVILPSSMSQGEELKLAMLLSR